MEVVLMKNEGGMFMKKHKIESRINEHTQQIQYNASKILDSTLKLVP
jgi:hypothetical protein